MSIKERIAFGVYATLAVLSLLVLLLVCLVSPSARRSVSEFFDDGDEEQAFAGR